MTRVIYGEVAVGAREDFEVESVTEELGSVSKNEQILQNLTFRNYSNPIEQYSVVLDDKNIPLPKKTDNLNTGYWSEQVSDDNGDFSQPIILTLTADDTYSSRGITFEFDIFNDIFSSRLLIDWYENEQKLSSKEFNPNSSVYFCENDVEEYNRLVITFYSTNVPKNRLHIRSIAFGETISFLESELVSVNVSHKIDISSLTIPIGTTNIKIRSEKASNLSFSEQQPIRVEFNGELEKSAYIKSANRTSKTDFSIAAEDAMAILDDREFVGGIYSGKIAYDLYAEIFKTANLDYEIDESFKEITVDGHLPFSTCREALQQLGFATNGVVMSKNGDKISVVPYGTVVNASSKQISIGMQKKQSVNEENAVTSFEITTHTYKMGVEEKTIFEDKEEALYLNEDGEGEYITVRTEDPCYDYTGGEIIEEHPNYVTFKYVSGITITAKAYDHIKKVHLGVLNLKHPEKNVKRISAATLTSENNIDKILEKCYNYYGRNKRAKSTIIDIDSIKIGDRLLLDMAYFDAVDGNVVSQSYSIVGNTLIKDTEII